MADRCRDVAVQRIHRALAARAPEQRVRRQLGCREDAVGSACRQRQRIGEQHGLGVDDRGEFAVLPERVDLGDVENVDRARFKAQEIGDDLHPVDQRVGVPVDVPLRVVLRRAADRRGPCHRLEANVEAGVELHPAEVDEAPRLHADVGKPHRLPEPHGNAGAQPAQAHRQRRIVGVGPARWPDLQAADRDREQARPADVGDRVDELAGAAARPRRSGRRGTAGKRQEQRGEKRKAVPCCWARFPDHGCCPGLGLMACSVTRRTRPCCSTVAGTARMPKRSTSLPPWSK